MPVKFTLKLVRLNEVDKKRFIGYNNKVVTIVADFGV